MKKTKVEWKTRRQMILWHIVNSFLAGGLVFVGAIADGHIGHTEMVASISVSVFVAITKFKEFWATQEGVYNPMFFHFIH